MITSTQLTVARLEVRREQTDNCCVHAYGDCTENTTTDNTICADYNGIVTLLYNMFERKNAQPLPNPQIGRAHV